MDLPEKRVLHVITRSEWGGAPRIVELLAEGTDADVAVACGPGGRLIDELRANDIPVFEQPRLDSDPDPVADARAFLDLLGLLRRESFDLVHCHSTKAGLLGRLAAAATNTPCIFTVHGWGFYNTEYGWVAPVIARGERLLARLTDEIVCVSRNDFEQGRRRGITSYTATEVIHNGVRPLSFPDDRTRLADVCDLDPNVPVIGAIARLAPQKKPLTILRTAKRLEDRGQSVQTILVGSGPLMDDCERYVTEHDLDDVYLLGFQEDALDMLPDLDVFLLPSRFEGFPLTVLESLHAGVPLVAYDVGGVAEAIDHGKTGFIVPAGDHDAFVEHVERLLGDDELRSQLSARARTTARSEFSAERMVADYKRVYERVLRQDST